MNDTTPIQSAPANVTVHKGTNIWRWGHIPQTSYSAPLEICAYPPTASVSNCSPYPHACQGMGVQGEWELSALRRSSEHLATTGSRHRSSPFCEKHMPRLGGAPRGSPYDALAPALPARAA